MLPYPPDEFNPNPDYPYREPEHFTCDLCKDVTTYVSAPSFAFTEKSNELFCPECVSFLRRAGF